MAPQRAYLDPVSIFANWRKNWKNLNRHQPTQKRYIQPAVRQHHPRCQGTEQGGQDPTPGNAGRHGLGGQHLDTQNVGGF